MALKYFLLLGGLLLIRTLSFSQQFSLPGDGKWYKVASIGGQHGYFEYTYSHPTGHNPSISHGGIQFINAMNITVQHHQTMGYSAWNQLQFSLLNFTHWSEIWVKATPGVVSGIFKINGNLNIDFSNIGSPSDADLSDNGGILKIYDKLSDNSHVYLGNMNVQEGSLGIGTGNPKTKLHINGDEFITLGDYTSSSGIKGIQFTGFRDNVANFYGASIEAEPSWTCCGNYPSGGYPGVKQINLNFNVHNSINWDSPDDRITAMSIRSNGSIGIGTNETKGYKLAVNGDAIFTKVKVKLYNNWPDYIFEPTYKLPSLKDVESYIKKNKHLPDVPSAKEVEAKGLDVGENQAELLKKIEELTLYIIEQNKKIEEINEKMEQQQKEIQALKTTKTNKL
jgi:hypothetical protein